MSDEFLNSLMDNILDGLMVPKFQVERAISPILGMFLADALTAYYDDKKDKKDELDQNLSGKFKMICAEFPLKKEESKQSTNIDWLLYNTIREELIFFELKTSDTSYKSEQLETYSKIIEKRIEKGNYGFLLDELNSLPASSSEHGKYENIINKINENEFKPKINKCKKARVVYLVPATIKDKLKNELKNNLVKVSFSVLSFSDLPDTITGKISSESESLLTKYSSEWAIIRDKLKKIDESSKAFRNKESNETERINYVGIVSFSEIVKKCEKERDQIWVGYSGGAEKLNNSTIESLTKREFKWDYTENSKGRKTPKNWIKGSAFLNIVNTTSK